MAISQTYYFRRQRRIEEFVVWFDAMRLRAAMQNISLPRMTEDEWKEYDKPTVGVFK